MVVVTKEVVNSDPEQATPEQARGYLSGQIRAGLKGERGEYGIVVASGELDDEEKQRCLMPKNVWFEGRILLVSQDCWHDAGKEIISDLGHQYGEILKDLGEGENVALIGSDVTILEKIYPINECFDKELLEGKSPADFELALKSFCRLPRGEWGIRGLAWQILVRRKSAQ